MSSRERTSTGWAEQEEVEALGLERVDEDPPECSAVKRHWLMDLAPLSAFHSQGGAIYGHGVEDSDGIACLNMLAQEAGSTG